MAVAATAQVPQLSEMNFMRSEKEDPAMQITAEAMWGENAQSGAQVSIKARLEQSEERKQYIANHPQAEQCRKQMEQRDNALPACRNITARANALDQYSFTVKYEKIPQRLMNATYQIYKLARYAGFPYNSENVVDVNNQANQLKLRVNFAEDHQSANVSIEAPHANAEFKNLPVPHMAKHILIINAQYDIDERMGYAALNGQYNPVCVADGSSAQTFDNKTYPLNLEKDSWYVLMTSAPKQRQNNKFDFKTQRNNNVTILVKQSGDNKKEVKVVLNNGEHVIDMQPTSNNDANAKIQVNKKEQRASKNNVNEVTDNQNQRIAQIYALPSGEVVVNMPQYGLVLNYDGSRVMVDANDRFRDAIRGLCGSFTGEKADDFITPRNCILREARDFVAAYSLSSNNKDNVNARLSNKEFCVPQKKVQFQQVINEKHTGHYVQNKRFNLKGLWFLNDNDNENNSNQSGNNENNRNKNWRHGKTQNSNENNSNNSGNRNSNESNDNDKRNTRSGNSNENNSKNKRNTKESNYDQHKGDSKQNGGNYSTRTKVVEQGNQLCFSAKPLSECNEGFRAENTAEKQMDFVCMTDGQQARQWKEQARKGEHISAIRRKNPNKTMAVEVPTKCIAA
uniref:Vitellogenin-2 n=1 Tax=Cacopsylla melanoneura TaxID=428564 RepID=A0A8D8QHH7_9HEMI